MEKKVLISQEVAEIEFSKWLEHFGFSDEDFNEGGQLASVKTLKSRIVNAIMYGQVSIEEDCTLIQKLTSPIVSDAGKVALDELKYKPDYQAWEQNACMKGLDLDKESSKVALAMAGMLTANGVAILGKLRSYDYKVLQSVVTFFSV